MYRLFVGGIKKLNAIKVAMIYSSKVKSLSDHYYTKNDYNFFKRAIFRNRNLEVDYVDSLNKIDVSRLEKDYDVILLPEFTDTEVQALKGIRDTRIPVIARAHDPHTVLIFDKIGLSVSLKVDWFFGFYAPATFYKYYPKHFRYEAVHIGLEPSMYENVKPWNERISDKIAISGILDKPDLRHRLYYRVLLRRPPELSSWYHYKLRTKCNSLPYVTHTRDILPGQSTDTLPELLSRFRAGIAATTSFPTIKYKETPAAGCLTFMEVTEQNHGSFLGYEDGKTAIFINDTNYTKKFQEYLDNPDDPRWERIAMAGRRYVLENLSNDKGVEKLVSMMRKALGEENVQI